MISNPPFYYRRYESDFPRFEEEGSTLQKIAGRVQSIVSATVPLLSYYGPWKTPLFLGLGGLRTFTHLVEIIQALRCDQSFYASIHTFQLLLSVITLACTVAAFTSRYFDPTLAILTLSVDDMISGVIDLIRAARANDTKGMTDNLLQITSSVLYLSFLSFGHIELLISVMLLQICLNLGRASEHFNKGHYIEGTCHLTYAIFTLLNVLPQIKVLQWKWGNDPVLEGTISRDERGFIYVKIDDKHVYELNDLFGNSDIPPYFGKGKAGAHVSVVPAGALPKNVVVDEVGKRVKFTLSYYDALKPSGFKGVNQVHFLGICCPELDALRSKYGFSPKIGGNHDWHLTFGVNYSNTP